MLKRTHHTPPLASGLSILALSGATLAGEAGATQHRACQPCKMVVTRAATLIGTDAVPVGNATSIVQDSRGKYYVTSESRKNRILVFDSTGRLLRVAGKQGEGTGEYGWAAELVMGEGDTLYAFDVDSGAISVLSPRLQLVRTLPLRTGFKWDALVLKAESRIVVNMFIGTAAAAGHPLHILDHQGTRLSSFGASESEIVRGDSKAATFRKLAQSQGDRIWAGRINEYRLELWTTAGERLREIKREATWFRPWSGQNDLTPHRPPFPELVAVHEDRAGLLWLMFNVADSGWKQSLRKVSTAEASTELYMPIDENAVFDTIVEVLDSTGALIASHRLPTRLIEFIDDGLVFGYQGESKVVPRLDIWRLRVVPP